jgi:hypothetical protein
MRLATFAFGLGLIALPVDVAAQSPDGVWRGQMACPAHLNMRAVNAPFQLTVASGQARYERAINTADGRPSGNVERGAGSVAPDGSVVLNGQGRGAPGSDLSTSFRGRLAGNAMTLEGEQRWTVNGRALPPRPCTIRVTRG